MERRAERVVAALFGLTALTGVLLLIVYALGGQTQVEGVLLALCLGGLGTGIVIWSQRLMNTPTHIEERHPLGSASGWQAAFREALDEEAGFSRRTLLIRLLGVALGGLAAALAIPVISFGPAPGKGLFHTAWKKGSRLVDAQGRTITSSTLPIGSIATVFPAGAPGDATSQAVLIHVPAAALALPSGRTGWAPDGYVCYSKVCTHAGCPVGLYRDTEHQLICPCHQSTFDVLTGANPVFGPAARPLPQLPITLMADGTFEAQRDFDQPVGPSFWDRTSQG
jgi:quinol---cytochrome c reductase iron-sulfur subunit